jgi:hypothetical protein
MTNIEPSSGHVILRGRRIEIDSDVGRAFAVDCVRFIEGVATEEQLRKKYGLLSDEAWRQLEGIEPLQVLIGRLIEDRLRDGTAQREKASLRWNSAIDTVHAIVQDPATPVRARIDGARELRACSTGTEDSKPDARERLTIHINFGTAKVHREIELTPIKQEIECEDDLPEPRATGIVSYTRG